MHVRLNGGWLPKLALGVLSLATALPGASPARAGAPTPTQPVAGVLVREWADGAGPSHVIPMGGYLLVVDPWDGKIRRYRQDDLQAAPIACTIPRSFAPWRTIRAGIAVRLVAEAYGPSDTGKYLLTPRQTMQIQPAQVAAMATGAPCGFAIQAYDAKRDTPPAIGRSKGEVPGAVANYPLPGGGRAAIMPRGGSRADVYAIREAGTLSGGRSLLWWSEIDAYPIEKPTAQRRPDAPGPGGRITASQYVGIFANSGGPPTKVIRIQTAAFDPLVPGTALPGARSVGKLGFEYVAGSSVANTDMLWTVAINTSDAAKPFTLRRYDLAAFANVDTLVLTSGGGSGAGRNDAEHVADAAPTGPDPAAKASREAWFDTLRPVFERQILQSWDYPQAAYRRPCGDNRDRCPVGSNAAGELGTGPEFTGKVIDVEADKGGAEWMRPRQLVGALPGKRRGVPYSIGGTYWFGARTGAEDFGLQRDRDYATPTRNPRPIGHIREGMEWSGDGDHYPLGIDCSALVAQIFGVDVRGTGRMRKAAPFLTKAGTSYALPLGPVRGCPQPVRHLSQILPGDVLLTEGHVVVYAGTARHGAASQRSRGLRVFESSSRCGGVCESVYDPSSLNGWWILRMRLASDKDTDCPNWIDSAAAILAKLGPS